MTAAETGTVGLLEALDAIEISPQSIESREFNGKINDLLLKAAQAGLGSDFQAELMELLDLAAKRGSL